MKLKDLQSQNGGEKEDMKKTRMMAEQSPERDNGIIKGS